MVGGQTRDVVVLRMVLAIACVALVALVAAPLALAGSPASDQYGSAIPGGGNGTSRSGGGSSDTGGRPVADSATSAQVTIPVAPDSPSESQASSSRDSGGGADHGSTGSPGKADAASSA